MWMWAFSPPEAQWHTVTLQILYQVLGWLAFTAWSLSFYPQVLLNFRRKSVVGLNFDYLVLNLSKHNFYLFYNACMHLSPIVQYQYHLRYGFSELIPVGPSDLAFSIHAVMLLGTLAYQVLVYERGDQKVSTIALGISGITWLAAMCCVGVAWAYKKWLWLVLVFNDIQVAITIIKYIPQAYMNYRRKSTVGYSIVNILLDLFGGIVNIFQMGVQSLDQGSMGNFFGNSGKMFYSLIVLVFDVIFVFQHYVLYREADDKFTSLASKDSMKCSTQSNDAVIQTSPMSHRSRFKSISDRFHTGFEQFTAQC